MSLAGEGLQVFALGNSETFAIKVDGANVYTCANTLWKIPLSGSNSGWLTPELIKCDGTIPFVVGATHVYWAPWYQPIAVTRAPIEGGTPSPFATGLDPMSALAVDDGHVYWASHGPMSSYTVFRQPVAGGAPEMLVSQAERVSALALDATHVYWTNDDATEGGPIVTRMPKAGGAPEVLANGTSAQSPTSLAMDDAYVYWTDDEGLRRVPKAGGWKTLVWPAYNNGAMSKVAVDATAVYWLAGDMKVLRLAK